MRKFEPTDYPNLLDKITLTYEDVENQIKDYSLEFPKIKIEEIEIRNDFPVFLICFHEYLMKNKEIIPQEIFWENYKIKNKDFFIANSFDSEKMSGFRARIYRTYASFVRDIHFALFLKHKFQNDTIIYNQNLDINEKIDILIIHSQKYYGIKLFTNTISAHKWKEDKQKKHANFDNVKYIELPVKFGGSVICGNFFLYGDREYNQLLNMFEYYNIFD